MKEEWRAVLGWPKYMVSNKGRVKGKIILKPILNRGGYHYVVLYGPRKNMRVHSLVLEAFVGPRPAGLVACHINDVRTDNRLENLKWGTALENQADAKRNGRTKALEQHPAAKLSNADRRYIVDNYKIFKNRNPKRTNARELAERFGVSTVTIVNVYKRRDALAALEESL